MKSETCPSCQAESPRGSAFCVQCGAPLTGVAVETSRATAPPPRPRRRAPAGRPRRSKHQILAGGRAVRQVRAMFFSIGLLILVPLTLLGLLLLQATAELGPGGSRLLWFVEALLTVAALASFAGAARAHRNPLPWALTLAGLLTLAVVSPLLLGSFPSLLNIVLAVAAWGTLPPILRAERLKKENPDDPAWATLRGATATERGRRRLRHARRALFSDFRSAGLLLGAVVLLVFGGVFGLSALARSGAGTASEVLPDEPLDAILARFEAAWAAGDLDRIGELYPPRLANRATRLRRRFSSHGLDKPLPALHNREITDDRGPEQAAGYTTAAGPVRLFFEHDGERWKMVALRLP